MGANATTFVPAYVAGEVLTAADLSVTNSGIPVFASTVERDAAFGGTGEKTLAEGQFAYLETGNVTQYYDGAAWLALGGKIGQVVSTAKLDTFTTTSATFVDVTGLTVTITPSSATSKILIVAQITTGYANAGAGHFRLNGGNASTYVGTAASNRVSGVYGAYTGGELVLTSIANSIIYLDSPATTSATTYAVQARRGASSTTAYVNRTSQDTDDANSLRGASSITVFEVLA